jgi:hypothetical protein
MITSTAGCLKSLAKRRAVTSCSFLDFAGYDLLVEGRYDDRLFVVANPQTTIPRLLVAYHCP